MADTTTLRLDPGVLRVWRTPHSVQYGIDEPLAVVDDMRPGHERLLEALRIGTGLHGLRALGSHYGLTHREINDLLTTLRPAMISTDADTPAATAHTATQRHQPERTPRVSILGTTSTATELTRLLTTSGIEVRQPTAPAHTGSPRDDLGIIVAHFVIHPDLRALWLRHDTPHLPIVWGDRSVLIGPIIEPGTGPCLHCLERHRTETDPAWPVIASQLIDQRSHLETPMLVADTVLTCARLVLERVTRGPVSATATRIDSDGQRSTIEVARHPECGCRSLADLITLAPKPVTHGSATLGRARRESVTPSARRAATTATMRRAVADEPA